MQTSGDVDVLDPSTGAVINTLSVATPAAVVGFGATSLAPPASALLLRLQTSTFIAGRRLKGRTFFSPVSLSVCENDGTPTAAAVAALVSGGNNLLAGLTAGDLWVIWHRPKTPGSGSGAPITAVSGPDRFAVLASRRP
jgi:hypothetical protein